MKRSISENLYFKWLFREHFLTYKNEKTNATTWPDMLKNVFSKINSKKGSKSFWNAIKSFFTNRGIINNDSITLEENRVLNNDPKKKQKFLITTM